MNSSLETALALWGWGVFVGLHFGSKIDRLDWRTVTWIAVWPVPALWWGGKLVLGMLWVWAFDR